MKKILLLFFIVFLLLSGFFMYKGFDYKNNYYSSDFSSLNKNAYVGGNAYNYIINGTYFTGYMVLTGSSMISGFICLFGLNIVKEKDVENKEIKESE